MGFLYGQRALLSAASEKAEDGAAAGGRRYPWEIDLDLKLLSPGTQKLGQPKASQEPHKMIEKNGEPKNEGEDGKKKKSEKLWDRLAKIGIVHSLMQGLVTIPSIVTSPMKAAKSYLMNVQGVNDEKKYLIMINKKLNRVYGLKDDDFWPAEHKSENGEKTPAKSQKVVSISKKDRNGKEGNGSNGGNSNGGDSNGGDSNGGDSNGEGVIRHLKHVANLFE